MNLSYHQTIRSTDFLLSTKSVHNTLRDFTLPQQAALFNPILNHEAGDSSADGLIYAKDGS